jgi:hypothetical protein
MEVISIYVDICGFLFQKSSVEKDCRDENLVISNNSNRNTLAVEIYKKFERAMMLGLALNGLLSPSLIASHISLASIHFF